MVKNVGRAMLLKISDGASGFQSFGGLTAKSIKINGERIDVTTPDPTTPAGIMWRETLSGARSVDLTGDVTLVGDAAEARAVSIAMSANQTDEFQVIVPGLGTWEGVFSLDLEFSGEGDLTGALAMGSTGAVTFTAA